jgi:hypothetical protein
MNPKQLVTIEDLEKFKQELLLEFRKIIKPANGNAQKKWLKTNEVLKLLCLSPGKLQTMRKSGALNYTRIGGSLFYDPEDINKMFENNKVNDK